MDGRTADEQSTAVVSTSGTAVCACTADVHFHLPRCIWQRYSQARETLVHEGLGLLPQESASQRRCRSCSPISEEEWPPCDRHPQCSQSLAGLSPRICHSRGYGQIACITRGQGPKSELRKSNGASLYASNQLLPCTSYIVVQFITSPLA